MQFTKATRAKSKLRLALEGPSGSGKTWGALTLAKGIGGKVAVIDTERGSASLYSHLLEFDTLELNPPFSPERFKQAIKTAETAGYEVLIIDSITHEWHGSGGCLEINDQIAQTKFRGNTWSAWSETKPRHRAFLDALIQSPLHIIATMRSKTETAMNDDKKIVRLGMKAQQEEGAEYEFTTVLTLSHSNHLVMATKDRTGLFKGDPKPLTVETGTMLLDWLNSGVDRPVTAIQQETHQQKPEFSTQSQPLTKEKIDEYMAQIDLCDDTKWLAKIFNEYNKTIPDLADKAKARLKLVNDKAKGVA